MRMETDLNEVKAVAEMLLMTDIHETSYSPVVVQHPFTSTGIVGVKENGEMKILDITENQENLSLWQKQVRRMIDEADSAFQIYMLVNKPYALTFLKLSEPYPWPRAGAREGSDSQANGSTFHPSCHL